MKLIKEYELIASQEDYDEYVAKMKQEAEAVFREQGDFVKGNPDKTEETINAIRQGTVTEYMLSIALSTARLTRNFLTPKTRPFNENDKEFARITAILSIDDVPETGRMWHLSLSQRFRNEVIAIPDIVAEDFAEAFFGKDYAKSGGVANENVRHYFKPYKDNSDES